MVEACHEIVRRVDERTVGSKTTREADMETLYGEDTDGASFRYAMAPALQSPSPPWPAWDGRRFWLSFAGGGV